MSLVVTHNLSAMQTQRNMTINSRGLSKSLEKLSSGYRINVGSDDPSGLVISEQLRSQISGVQRAIRNTSEACNLIGLTEGALIEINEILKRMRQLAIHAANSGITSPEQVKADQAELDSGVSTIDRIANTTSYSDQFILNGSKQLVYDRLTEVKTTMDHPLINMQSSRVDQIFRRSGASVTFSHSALTADGYANDAFQAKKAYIEADRLMPDPHHAGEFINSPSQYDASGRLTFTQEFILTGSKGTKLFKFAEGEHLGTVAQAINNVKDSLGIGAALIFGSDARIDSTAGAAPADVVVFDLATAGVNAGAGGGIALAPALAAASLLAGDPGAVPPVPPMSFNFGGIVDKGNWLADVFQFRGEGDPPPAGTVSFSLRQPANAGDSWELQLFANGKSLGVFYPGDPAAAGGIPGFAIPSGPLTGAVVSLPQVTAGAEFNSVSGSFALTFQANVQKPELFDHRAAGDIQIYGANLNGGPTQAKVAGASLANPSDFRVGLNCDGDGRVYAKVVKFTDTQTYEVEWYKDAACTMLIGVSAAPGAFSATNNSGIRANGLAIGLTNASQVGDVYTLVLAGQEFTPARDSDGKGGIDQPADFNIGGMPWSGMTDDSLARSVMSGVRLGYNTSSAGTLFFRASGPANDRIIEVFMDESMTPASRVAYGRANLSGDPNASPPGNSVIRLEEVMMENGGMSGLNITLCFSGSASSGPETGTIDFTNLALRLYSNDYGGDEFIRIQNNQGQLFHQFRHGDSLDRSMIPEKAVVQVDGQDATIAMNGFPVVTKGLVANVTTPDFQGAMVFHAGTLGQTTIAQAGYEIGSLFSRAQALQGVPEDETLIRQTQLGLAPAIVPSATANAIPIAGISTGVSPETPDSGQLRFDFSGIDVSGLLAADPAGFSAAFNGGLSFTILPPSTPAPNNDAVNIAVAYRAADGSWLTHTESDVPFARLNSIDGYSFGASSGLFAGLNLKANQWAGAGGLPAEGAAVAIASALREPEFDPLAQVFTYATNARHGTSERLEQFIGGMQFQLGGNSGDQDRTVYSIPSMVMANIGRLEWEGRTYTLQEVLDGGAASLSRDPILAMRVIAQAVDDVAALRGRLGAFQSNMLQTNQSSLETAIEMLAKTESAIRDADMAGESTEFTKNQILMQAGTAMLAQANQINQNVLQLLG